MIFPENFLLYLLLGAFAGTTAGLLGLGGGLIIVPALVFIFNRQGMPAEFIMHLAIGTSLASISITSISSVVAHHLKGAVLWDSFLFMAPGIMAGALIGAVIADYTPAGILGPIFGVFELAVGFYLLFGKDPSPKAVLPGRKGLVTAGGAIGVVSAMLGIGGGSMTVPFFVWRNVNMRRAVATSSACGIVISISGGAGFIFTGWDRVQIPWTTGFVYWPGLVSIAVASMLFAPLGAKLAHTVPLGMLKKLFGMLLLGLGIKMIV